MSTLPAVQTAERRAGCACQRPPAPLSVARRQDPARRIQPHGSIRADMRPQRLAYVIYDKRPPLRVFAQGTAEETHPKAQFQCLFEVSAADLSVILDKLDVMEACARQD